jgi:hypothetical protein
MSSIRAGEPTGIAADVAEVGIVFLDLPEGIDGRSWPSRELR